MKIFYCIRATYNPGGMERVMLNKVSYLVRNKGWDITVVTTDQQGRAPFYSFPKEVRMIDLDINYADDNDKGALYKIAGYLKRRRAHRQRLKGLLMSERPDIVVSLFPSESSFIPDIKDGSKKVLELHFCKLFRLQYRRSGLLGLIDRIRTKQDERLVRKFDKFVVLTDEDKGYWGKMQNIIVIPNAARYMGDRYTDNSRKRVIAVGRLDYQKGFDRLIQAWEIIQRKEEFQDWILDIFGQGEWHEMLQQMIACAAMTDTVHINPPTNSIADEYANSSLIVMTSNYEGFGMVLVEAMACGVPGIAFDCKCGPKDIIRNGVNGLLVQNGDIKGLAEAMMKLMGNESLRKEMSVHARDVIYTYSEERVMARWVSLFEELGAKRNKRYN